MYLGRTPLLLIVAACSGTDDKETDTGSPTGTDADADTDSDTDTDTDTDADTDATDSGATDTGTPPDTLAPIEGSWLGTCLVDPAVPWPDYSFIDLRLALQELSGEVQGTGEVGLEQVVYYGGSTGGGGTPSTYTTFVQVPVVLRGTWDSAELALEFGIDQGSYVEPFPLALSSGVSGDVMTGDLTLFPSGTSGYTPILYACTLDRR